MNKNHIKILHIVFWSVTLISTSLQTIPSYGKSPLDIIIEDFVFYSFSYFIVFYFFYFFITKKLIDKKSVKSLLFFGLLFILLSSAIFSLIYLYVFSVEIFASNFKEFLAQFKRSYFSFLETSFIFASSGSLIKIAVLWYDYLLKQKDLEKQSAINELALFKSRINPGFLVNTLKDFMNRIENTPDTAIMIIENLSDIMSYILYDAKKDYIELNKEIKILDEYFYLQKTKYDSIVFHFDINDNSSSVRFSPLLLLTYTDTLFNLDINYTEIKDIFVFLNADNNTLTFNIKFLLIENTKPQLIDKSCIENPILKCMNLLYKNNYKIDMSCTKESYHFDLTINYSTHFLEVNKSDNSSSFIL